MPDTRISIPKRIDLTDRRTLIGLGVALFCTGLILGARIGRGSVPPATSGSILPPGVASGVVPPGVIFRDRVVPVPCADCAEKEGVAYAAKVTEQAQADVDAAIGITITEPAFVPPYGEAPPVTDVPE